MNPALSSWGANIFVHRKAGSGVTHPFASFAVVYRSCPRATVAKRADDRKRVVYIIEAKPIEKC